MRARNFLSALDAVLCVLAVGCAAGETSSGGGETTSQTRDALTTSAIRVMGFELTSDWTASSGQLSVGPRRIEGSASLQVANPGYAVITSRALSTLGSGVSTLIGFDIQIPESQPNPSWFGAAQLFVNLPSRGINNVLVGQKDLTYMPRGIFQRVEFPMSASLQAALRSTFTDLRFSIVLSAPPGATPYLLDRLSFAHAESEQVDNSRNTAILGFETSSSWTTSAGSVSTVSRRTEKGKALSVMPSGYTVLTSDRLATPSSPSASVSYDVHVPHGQPNPYWPGETQLLVDLPSKGIFNHYVDRRDIGVLPADTFSRVTFTLPPAIASRLGEQFDDLRFKIVLNAPLGAGPFLLDRFRFGGTGAPSEKVDVTMPLPANVAPSKLLFLAKHDLTIGSRVRVPNLHETRMLAASLGGVSLGDFAEIDSVLGIGTVALGASTKVRGFVAGTSDVRLAAGAEVFGSSGGAPGPVAQATWTTVFEPASVSIHVQAGTHRQAAPGRYGSIDVSGGTLTLAPGEYRVDRFVVGSSGRVEFDTNRGSFVVFVRSELALDGSVNDLSLGQSHLPPRRARSSSWLYSGTVPTRVPVDFPGRLVAPDATVVPFWDPQRDPSLRPPVTGGIWAERIAIPTPPSALSGTIQALGPPVLDPWENSGVSTPLLNAVTDVRVGEQDDPTAGRSAANPVTVDADNPAFFGSFAWHSANEAGSGIAPYFHDGTWTSIIAEHIALRHFPSNDVGWGAALLPGAPSQSPATREQAVFETRTFNLFHGKTFQISRALVHQSDAQWIGLGSDSRPLFVRLNNGVRLVPVFIVAWDSPDQTARVATTFDFIPSLQFAAAETQVGLEPSFSGPFTNPGEAQVAGVRGAPQVPPDEIWSQCGIQFRVVGGVYLGPNPHSPFNPGTCVQNNQAGQDYAAGYPDLDARLRAALPTDMFETLFGDGIQAADSGGIRPIIIQYGQSSCSAYSGKTDAEGLGYIQINDDHGQVAAHEIGHTLFHSADHVSDATSLMSPSASGRSLTAEQCDLAATNAEPYDERLRAHYVALGWADATPLAPGPFPLGPALTPRPVNDLACCALPDGIRKIRTLASICFMVGGTRTSNCTVCCRSRRACPSDACCARSLDAFAAVDANECEAEDLAPVGSCTCCRFPGEPAGGCVDPLLPPEVCQAAGGGNCPVDPPT